MILTNKSSKFSGDFVPRPPTGFCPVPAGGAYRPPADFPTLALRVRGVPKLTSGYVTELVKQIGSIYPQNFKVARLFLDVMH